MPRDFYPRREADILAWTGNFRAKIDSIGESLGVSPSQIEAYGLAQERFASLYRAAQSPTQRTPSVMVAKNTARIGLEAISRQLAAAIGAQENITSETRVSLGLALRRRGGYRRALPPPAEPPHLLVRLMDGRIATIVLSDRNGDKRRKPRGASSAIIFSYVCDAGVVGGPPANIREWSFAGQTTRTIARVAFDARLEPGTRVWLSACWVNSKGKEGRPCEPVMTYVGGGGSMMQPPNVSARRSAAPRMLFVAGPALAKAA
jgi:hypothetical protein